MHKQIPSFVQCRDLSGMIPNQLQSTVAFDNTSLGVLPGTYLSFHKKYKIDVWKKIIDWQDRIDICTCVSQWDGA